MDGLIAHVSDLHFGREDPAVVQGLVLDLKEQNPALIVVSGDLTQRARTAEFSAAKRFLAELPFPKLVVPGNHDIPLLHLWERFLYPFRRYNECISAPLNPFVDMPPFAIVGINTVVPRRWKEGRISSAEFSRVKEILKSVSRERINVLVMHHPLREALSRPVNMKWFEELKIRIILSGHHHLESSAMVPLEGTMLGQTVTWIQAGTAVSVRHRGEANSYNLIRIDKNNLNVYARVWSGKRFELKIRRVFDLKIAE